MAKLILTSYGLTTKVGRKLISKELKKDANLGDKNIFLVSGSDSIRHVKEADYL